MRSHPKYGTGTTPPSRRVLLVHDLGALPPVEVEGQQHWSWIYFGNQTAKYFAVRSALRGRGREILAGPLLNETVDEFRDELLNFDELLEIKDELLWQTSDLAHRNALSGFLTTWCCVIVLNRLRAELDGDLVVVVEDPAFFKQLVRMEACGGAGNQSPIGAPTRRLRRLCSEPRLLKQAMALRVNWLRTSGRARRLPRRLFPVPFPRLDIDVLIASWVPPDTFDPEKLIPGDAYFGLLPEALRANGLRVGWIAMPTEWVHPLEAILPNVAAARDVVVTAHAALGWRDAIWIACKTLRTSARCKDRFLVGGVDLTEFLEEELRREKLSVARLWALRSYRLGRLLAREFSNGTIVFLFENQPWEKALRLGARSRRSGISLLGLMQTPFSMRWFPYFPSRRDLASGQLPDRVGAIGQLWKRLFIEHGYPAERIDVVPALRYAHLGRLASQGDPSQLERATVVVAGSIGFSDSLELVVKALTALNTLTSVRVVLKLHPRMGGDETFFQAVLSALDRDQLPPHVEVATGSVSEALSGAGVLLYTTTTVAYEALAAGVPLVFVQSDFWFDTDPFPASLDGRSIVRTPQEIRGIVEELLSEDAARVTERQAHVQEFMADALEPADPERLARLLRERHTGSSSIKPGARERRP